MRMPGAIHELLSRDHERLDALLARADVDRAAYSELRAGLLRHIAMEEKVLLPEAKRLRGGEPLPIVKQLKADHAALASLLVPPPTAALVATIRGLLAEHNPLEEGPAGMYAACEALIGGDAERILEAMRAVPVVRASAHLDEPRIHDHIARMLQARRKRES
jgi:hypothetical protein